MIGVLDNLLVASNAYFKSSYLNDDMPPVMTALSSSVSTLLGVRIT